ncbi:ABC-F family ATP-binding cassette domain-containing protein [Zooshikella harenae]|uniref:ABC-F family ATP-binding cassette domain-containing protein n=1 Tax=Zooshikella harenae TaxID=2827238 RepID=A0ABS5ZEL7_9GAMM|nr:ABC-F family ATP-binding cassette domain-containing protein [Zooshikella harenae]MBU2712430.1 ABC-F family ATP-binding cassette domain-containing protein [Zooshikella harenae]
MSLLCVTELNYQIASKMLYHEASLTLHKNEHMGIVGKNGTGKSTLLKIITAEITADSGNVHWQSNSKVGYLDQHAQIDDSLTVIEYLHTAFAHLAKLEDQMIELYSNPPTNKTDEAYKKAANIQLLLEQEGYYTAENTIAKVVLGLGLNAFGLNTQIGRLSGGQRAKVILAKLLIESPDVLLLDEPTNFLDVQHIKWLEIFLTGYKGALILVSHDTRFLDKIVTSICDIDNRKLTKYRGNYSAFLTQKEQAIQHSVVKHEKLKQKKAKLENYINRNAAGVNARIAKGRKKMLARITLQEHPVLHEKLDFDFPASKLAGHEALTTKQLEVGYNHSLLPAITLSLATGEKLAIKGFNGIGKSTLLKTLVHQVSALSGSYQYGPQTVIGYFRQDLHWDSPQLSPLQLIAQWHQNLKPGAIRSLLARCGIKDDQAVQPVHSLSGGEQTRVKLCHLMASPRSILILDEPTTHLDAHAKENLKKAIQNFKGSVILVCHEVDFYSAWIDHELNITEFVQR